MNSQYVPASKCRYFTYCLFFAFWFSGCVCSQTVQEVITCYAAAYPETVLPKETGLLVNGHYMAVSGVNHQSFQEKLNDATLTDQLSYPYYQEFRAPTFNEDPGRFRNADFFDAMYGDNQAAIQQSLVKVMWEPTGSYVRFTSINKANEALANVGTELAGMPSLKTYVMNTNGTFNYRVIAGTSRKSAHAYGIAIDIKFPAPLYQYWRWRECKPSEECTYPEPLLSDKKLQQIVRIFEKNGFIWGGKWSHYDSMHFEYRPELLHKQCQFNRREK